ncbi:type I phosphomannose isomerase catalytic subunit [Rathayibacter soli]|uniref:type I phosphomannose isomerase catalytic subunit n=1 Tax=Rathayibacter soli TaxID=3144168 RepID=UPI0027E55891|nr:type I phosphomannose isomerase catalytic subunit [Glaciibacter superstes]
MFVRIDNTPRDYAWGSKTAIAQLLGRPASGGPEAELWLGAHPGSPSRIVDPSLTGGATNLAEWVARDPRAALGGADARGAADAAGAAGARGADARGAGSAVGADAPRLTFLLKLLAAAGPLSLQAHPSSVQAAEGYARENAAGVPLDSPVRNYKDPFHKPELVFALSERFEALCGFRPLADSIADLDRLIAAASEALQPTDALTAFRARLAVQTDAPQVLRSVVAWLLGSGAGVAGAAGVGGVGVSAAGVSAAGVGAAGAGATGADAEAGAAEASRAGGAVAAGAGLGSGTAPNVSALVAQVVDAAARVVATAVSPAAGAPTPSDDLLPFATVGVLASAYPGDPGIVLSLLLNRVSLKQGEALYLPAGNIHAYLNGLAVELMSASDNVLRGGLTPKHIDVPELLSVLHFAPRAVPYLRPELHGDDIEIFRPDVPDFQLVRVALGTDADDPETTESRVALNGPAIVLCTDGGLRLRGALGEVTLRRGEAAYVTPDEASVTIVGDGTLFIATGNA